MSWPQYQRGECIVDGDRVYFWPIAMVILSTLLLRRGCVISAYELADLCWPDPDFMPVDPEKTIMVHVCKMRRAVPDVIETDWGRGFYIPLPDEQQSIAA